MRAPGMTLHKMPLFVWGELITVLLPRRSGAGRRITMVIATRNFGTAFLLAGGGDPALVPAGFFGHPEVYIMIVPGFASSAT